MRRPRRTNSSTPNSSSSDFTCVVMVGWLTPSSRAAAVKLPLCATAWKERSWVCLILIFSMDDRETLNWMNVKPRPKIVHQGTRKVGSERGCGATAIRSTSGSAPACSTTLGKVLAGRAYCLVTYDDANGGGIFAELTRRVDCHGRRTRRPWCATSAPIPTSSASRSPAALYAAATRPVEAIVALGGGSVMDAAKVLAAADGDFDRVRRFLETGMGGDALGRTPIIAIPTTAGTGSEVTSWATVWDTEANEEILAGARDALSRGRAGRSRC